LRARPRAKGNRAELAIVNMLKDFGWKGARRNWQSGGQGGGDIVNGPPDTSIEVKHCENARIWEWLAQCEQAASPTEIPLLFFRRNATGWYVALPADELLALLKLREQL
jgi:hypothetical protein